MSESVTANGPRRACGPRTRRWKYDPNNGLFYQLSTGSYFDDKCGMYFRDGKWF